MSYQPHSLKIISIFCRGKYHSTKLYSYSQALYTSVLALQIEFRGNVFSLDNVISLSRSQMMIMRFVVAALIQEILL